MNLHLKHFWNVYQSPFYSIRQTESLADESSVKRAWQYSAISRTKRLCLSGGRICHLGLRLLYQVPRTRTTAHTRRVLAAGTAPRGPSQVIVTLLYSIKDTGPSPDWCGKRSLESSRDVSWIMQLALGGGGEYRSPTQAVSKDYGSEGCNYVINYGSILRRIKINVCE